MQTDNTYNGWKNYATWRINLEIVDDLTSTLANDVADGYQEPFSDLSEMVESLAQAVDDALTGYGELEDVPAADLALSYARSFVEDVDFWEIAEAHARDYPHLIASDEDEDVA